MFETQKAEEPEVDYTMLYDSDGYSDDEERQRDIKKYNAQYEASGVSIILYLSSSHIIILSNCQFEYEHIYVRITI